MPGATNVPAASSPADRLQTLGAPAAGWPGQDGRSPRMLDAERAPQARHARRAIGSPTRGLQERQQLLDSIVSREGGGHQPRKQQMVLTQGLDDSIRRHGAPMSRRENHHPSWPTSRLGTSAKTTRRDPWSNQMATTRAQVRVNWPLVNSVRPIDAGLGGVPDPPTAGYQTAIKTIRAADIHRERARCRTARHRGTPLRDDCGQLRRAQSPAVGGYRTGGIGAPGTESISRGTSWSSTLTPLALNPE